jgi:hypothetical protein
MLESSQFAFLTEEPGEEQANFAGNIGAISKLKTQMLNKEVPN